MTAEKVSSLLGGSSDEASEAILWERFWVYGNEDCRNALVDYYNPFVRNIAVSLYWKNRHTGIQLEDCIQYGFLGLLDAIPRYQSLHQAKFCTYASYRIKGEIYSGINRYFEFNSVLKYKKENEDDRIDSIRRHNSETEGLLQLIDATADIAFSIYLDEMDVQVSESKSGSSGCIDRLVDQLSFISLIDTLSEAYQEVLWSHYFYERTFSEIALTHRVSKARISQLHAEAIKQLRLGYLKELDAL